MQTKVLVVLLVALLGLTAVNAAQVSNRLRARMTAPKGVEATLGEGNAPINGEGEGEGEGDGEGEGEAATSLVGGGCKGDCGNQAPSVEDAVAPVGDWLKDFKKRTGGSGDLYRVAEATVAPLLTRLEREQKLAQERLARSNAAILEHIKSQATEHMYTLLKQAKSEEDKEEKQEESKEVKEEAEEELEEAKEKAELKEKEASA